jgi:glutathione S-transferase
VLRLVTIPISHYCEKARWALDRAGLAYREERHVQGVHVLAARRAGGGPTVPVLVTPGGSIGESAQILAWADARMEPELRLLPVEPARRREVEALCRRFDELLGPHGRRLIYVHLFPLGRRLLDANDQGVPRWEDLLMRTAWPLMVGLVRRHLEIRPGVEARDETIVWRELDYVAGLLADGRPYLAGDRFGAADLTFAALSAPVVLPRQYGVALPPAESLGADTAALVRRAREHPAGAFALRMFELHRRPPAGEPAGSTEAGGGDPHPATA